MRNTGRSWRY